MRRRERVYDLVLVDGYDTAEQIARVLLAEQSITSKSLASATRLVQSDIALLKDDPTEARRYVERRLYAMRGFRLIAGDDGQVEFSVVTPKGEVVSVSKPRWPAGVRVRALRYFAEEAEAIARVNFIDVTGKRKQKMPGGEKAGRYTGAIPIDLSAITNEEERKAISEAMRRFPGGSTGGDDNSDEPSN